MSNSSRMDGIRPCEFRASLSCLERTRLFEGKVSGLLLSQHHLDRSWEFSQRFRCSVRTFHRSRIFPRIRLIFDDGLDTNFVSDLVGNRAD